MDMPIALITGASRGVGRGIATALASDGFTVFSATGRRIDAADLPDSVTRIRCDHLRDEETAAAFARLPGLDLLVNSAWGGYERMVENGEFTWLLPFWQQPLHRWSSMMDAGVRAAFVCSQHAARIMVPQRRGLIVNISFWAAQKYLGNSIYGIAKAATDKMTRDLAQSAASARHPGRLSLSGPGSHRIGDASRPGFVEQRKPRVHRPSDRRALSRSSSD